eukprot:4667787-Pyramimonas_sp.AAC.1
MPSAAAAAGPGWPPWSPPRSRPRGGLLPVIRRPPKKLAPSASCTATSRPAAVRTATGVSSCTPRASASAWAAEKARR